MSDDNPIMIDTGFTIDEAQSYVEILCECEEYVEFALPWRPTQCENCGRHWNLGVEQVSEDDTVNGYEWDGERKWRKEP